ncbi:MAG: GNAT family N-acetyltransferase [Marinosulfonomonas sp.]
MIEIRPATQDDTDAILKLWHQGWHDAHAVLVPASILRFRTPEYFTLWFEQAENPFWVAAHDQVLGFVTTQGAELEKLYVAPQARGSGVATALLRHGEQMISQTGVAEAKLFCTAGNTRAERFYQRHGWAIERSFVDALWTPEATGDTVAVQTHCFRKQLGPDQARASSGP